MRTGVVPPHSGLGVAWVWLGCGAACGASRPLHTASLARKKTCRPAFAVYLHLAAVVCAPHPGALGRKAVVVRSVLGRRKQRGLNPRSFGNAKVLRRLPDKSLIAKQWRPLVFVIKRAFGCVRPLGRLMTNFLEQL